MDINTIIEQVKPYIANAERDFEFNIQIDNKEDYYRVNEIKHQIENELKYRVYIANESLMNVNGIPLVIILFIVKVNEPLVFEEV